MTDSSVSSPPAMASKETLIESSSELENPLSDSAADQLESRGERPASLEEIRSDTERGLENVKKHGESSFGAENSDTAFMGQTSADRRRILSESQEVIKDENKFSDPELLKKKLAKINESLEQKIDVDTSAQDGDEIAADSSTSAEVQDSESSIQPLQEAMLRAVHALYFKQVFADMGSLTITYQEREASAQEHVRLAQEIAEQNTQIDTDQKIESITKAMTNLEKDDRELRSFDGYIANAQGIMEQVNRSGNEALQGGFQEMLNVIIKEYAIDFGRSTNVPDVAIAGGGADNVDPKVYLAQECESVRGTQYSEKTLSPQIDQLKKCLEKLTAATTEEEKNVARAEVADAAVELQQAVEPQREDQPPAVEEVSNDGGGDMGA